MVKRRHPRCVYIRECRCSRLPWPWLRRVVLSARARRCDFIPGGETSTTDQPVGILRGHRQTPKPGPCLAPGDRPRSSELSVAFITSVPPQGWWEDKPPVDKPDDAVRKTQEPLLSRDAAPRVVR